MVLPAALLNAKRPGRALEVNLIQIARQGVHRSGMRSDGAAHCVTHAHHTCIGRPPSRPGFPCGIAFQRRQHPSIMFNDSAVLESAAAVRDSDDSPLTEWWPPATAAPTIVSCPARSGMIRRNRACNCNATGHGDKWR